jgi:hypothetical protein
MSVTTSIYLDRRNLPTTASWQGAIDALEIGLALDPGPDTSTHEGYWPATIQGLSSGFEFYLENRGDSDDDQVPIEVGDRGLLVLLVTHSDLVELKCALLAAVALARLADGIIVNDELEIWSTDVVETEALSIS